ncbi:phage terminase large subunit [Candidatus Dojkabacteria bacterium]|nr:phage terminase large subunit [Candidatus Dojkabacteria bacterium]
MSILSTPRVTSNFRKIPEPPTPPVLTKHEELVAKVLELEAIKKVMEKRSYLKDLYKFNTEIMQVEGENREQPLSAFHRELCDFVMKEKSNKQLILVPRAHLKALKTNGTKILTPEGFKRYKDLKVGDEVIGGDGLVTKIKVVHPKSKMELYKVTTNDGREIVCNEEHLFKVRVMANDKKWKIQKLGWIMKRYSKERFDKRRNKTYLEHSVQLKPIPFISKEIELPIDPYTLGMWLGDGHSAGSRVTSVDPEEFEYSSFKWEKRSSKYLYDTHGLQKLLRINSLLNNKHIPEKYLISSYKQRLELLRGLMDTDGTCHCQGGIAYFSNTNYRLIKDIVSLIRSLGGVAMVCKVDMCVNDLPYDTWTVSVKLPNNENPFNLKRKVKQYKGLKRELTINIVDIEKVDDDIANCITVESDDGMFVSDDYFPTHNSTVVTVAYSLLRIAQDPSVRILIANATFDMACSFLGQIKKHLQNNEKFKEYYGDLATNAEKWSENMITVPKVFNYKKKEATVTAYGVGGNLVSQHYDVIIMDDVVNRDFINTAEQIDKTILFYKDALDLLEPDGKLIVIGTRWADADLYGWIMDKSNPDRIYEGFEVFLKQAYTGNLETGEDLKLLFPEKFTQEYLIDLKRNKGPLEFANQWMNDPMPSEEAKFKPFWFKNVLEDELKWREINYFTCVDPAIGQLKHSDRTAIVTIGVDQFNNWFIVNIIWEKLLPNEIIDHIFANWEHFQPRKVGIEMVAYQKSLHYTIIDEMRRRNIYLPVVELKASRSKEERIEGLVPRYANGSVYHLQQCPYRAELEDELLRFPRGKHDDIIDALAYMNQIAHQARENKPKWTRDSEDRPKRGYLY